MPQDAVDANMTFMARLHAPELEDEPWFPRPMRDALTAFLQVSSEKLGIFDAAAPVLRDVLARHEAKRVVDLCSGGGGPLLSILEHLDGVDAVLTDLYPNVDAFDAAERRLPGRVRGHREPCDATDVPIDGVRTIFNALHHFRPPAARKILEDAAHKRQPICVFEVVERHPLAFAIIAGVPFAVLAFTPFTKPDAKRLALTYGLPLIPLATGWDGLMSCLRAYSLAELRALADGIDVDGYAFRVGQAERGRIPMRVTWLIGEPTDAAARAHPYEAGDDAEATAHGPAKPAQRPA